jgi:hypothetical protein
LKILILGDFFDETFLKSVMESLKKLKLLANEDSMLKKPVDEIIDLIENEIV